MIIASVSQFYAYLLCLGACLGLVGDFFLIVKTDGWFGALGVTHEEVDVSSPACGTTCEAAKEAAKHGAAPRHLALSTSAQLLSRARVTQIIHQLWTVKEANKYCGNFNNI